MSPKRATVFDIFAVLCECELSGASTQKLILFYGSLFIPSVFLSRSPIQIDSIFDDIFLWKLICVFYMNVIKFVGSWVVP